MHSQLQLINRIYTQKSTNITHIVTEWFQQKLANECTRNTFQQNMLEHLRLEIEKTMVSMGGMLGEFSQERLGRKTGYQGSGGGSANGNGIGNRPSEQATATETKMTVRENSTEIAYFLQRVESSMGTEVGGYERMAAEVVRSIQIRMKFIDDNLQTQRKIITDKSKLVKGTLTSPYTFADILKLDELVDNQIQSRMLMRKEIDEAITILANEQFKVINCFKDNMQAFQKQYPNKFSQGYVFGNLLAQLRSLLQSKQLYLLKYYIQAGMDGLKTEQKIQHARDQYQLFKLQTKQSLESKINFQTVYSYFYDEIITRQWSLSTPSDLSTDQWSPCRGLVTVNGLLILVNHSNKQKLKEFDLTKMEYGLERAFVLKLTQKSDKKGLMKFFEGGKALEELVRFNSADEMEVFELYCGKWR